jgi:hypothetical protein
MEPMDTDFGGSSSKHPNDRYLKKIYVLALCNMISIIGIYIFFSIFIGVIFSITDPIVADMKKFNITVIVQDLEKFHKIINFACTLTGVCKPVLVY